MDGRRGLSLLPRASPHARIPLGGRDTRAPTPQPRPLGRCSPARLPLRDPAEPAKLRVCRSHTGRVSPGKGISPALPRSAPPPHRAMAAADDANVPTPAASETPDAATAPAARARSWAEIASAKDEPHRTGPDARAPGSRTIPEATGATDRPSHPPLGERSGSAANSLAPPPTPAGLEVVSVSADTVALRWTPGDAATPRVQHPNSEPRAAKRRICTCVCVCRRATTTPRNTATRCRRAATGGPVPSSRSPRTFQRARSSRRSSVAAVTTSSEYERFSGEGRKYGAPLRVHLPVARGQNRGRTAGRAPQGARVGPRDVDDDDGVVAPAGSQRRVQAHRPSSGAATEQLRRLRVPKTNADDSDGDVAEEVPVWDGCVATLTGLEPATAYAVTVSAKNLVGTSAPSEVLVGTTEPAPRSAGKSKKPKNPKHPSSAPRSSRSISPPRARASASPRGPRPRRFAWSGRRAPETTGGDAIFWWSGATSARRDASGRFRAIPGRSIGGEWSVASSPARRRRKTPARCSSRARPHRPPPRRPPPLRLR